MCLLSTMVLCFFKAVDRNETSEKWWLKNLSLLFGTDQKQGIE